jgi:signal transduction histidine kinase
MLAGLLLIPLLSLAALWGFIASVTLSNVVRNQHYNTVTNTIGGSIIGLEETLGEERTLTLAWLGTGRRSSLLRTELLSARRATPPAATAAEAATTSVRGLLSPAGQTRLSALSKDLGGLAGIRAAVDSGADSPETAFAAYNAIESALIAFFDNSTPPADPTLNLMTQATIAESRAADFTAAAAGLIEGALAAGGQMRQPERVLLAQIAAEQNLEIGDMFALANPQLTALCAGVFGSAAYRQFAAAENQVLSSPASRPVPLRPASFQATTLAIQQAQQSVLPQFGAVLGAESAQLKNSLRTELYLAGGLGLIAVVASVFVAVRFGRRFRVELTGLYDSARQMAEERLPRLVERLRRGDDVDVDAESPPLRPGRITETANVARAFTAVQRTAVEAAVGQANLRKGVNQVFVSLSLRNQSLLHRQLGMLDEMERATSDPVALADLFRLDHLTTRMRRHAEGLLILAGSTPGRGWRDPVPVADVLNAAVAEVEDYVRVDVITDSADAVAGTAVSDVIHLLAELVENATQFSPPNTRVEVRGDSVGHGFAVEIEDRGLGMPADEIAALNARLANPPEFDLANSDQLGLFVAARLAHRHDIKISLRQSPFGGTNAIVLLPLSIMGSAQEAGWAPGAAGTGGAGEMPPTAFGLTGRNRRLESAPEPGPVPAPRPAPAPRSVLPPALEPPVRPARELPAPQRPEGAPAADGWFSRVQSRSGTVAGGSRPGLPRRARGTNLAPQLRAKLSAASPAAGQEEFRPPTWPGSAGALEPEPPDRSPEETSSLLSALQDGWERARIENLDLDYYDGEEHR